MNSRIKDIIDFFGKHNVSEQIKLKVWRLMLIHRDDSDADYAYKKLWEEAGKEEIYNNDLNEKTERQKIAFQSTRNSKEQVVRLWWSRIAAVLLPLLIIVSAINFFSNDKNSTITEQISMIQRQTTLEDSAIVTLPDGSVVKLRKGSVLLYPSSFEGSDCKVYLVGNATFDVRHDEKRSLRVVTPYFEITDLGTVFDVTSYPDSEESSATVSSGTIALKVNGNDHAYKMSKDDMLVYNASTKKVFTGKREELSQKWKREQINFDDATFKDAVNVLSKNYGISISVRNHRFDDMRITVHFNNGETLENSMRIIASMLPGMHYSINGQKVVIE